ncbi:hypothetical protein ISS37_08490 [candidate division KSB1 bacterium]|nr:hypothetical protein [candidate division KSB1 bacterium]
MKMTFIVVSIFTTLYFAIRALSKSYLDFKTPSEGLKNKSTWEWLFISGLFQFWFNFIGSAIGWLSIYFIYKIINSIGDLSKISVGISALLIFLSLVAIAGITGHLPQTILKIRLRGKD